MDFSLFGIGFPQIMLILVIALIVFGPERLPGMARQAGRYINQLRRLTQDARGEIQSLTRELDIRDDLNSVKADLLNIKNDLTATAGSITRDFENIRKDITLRDEDGKTMGVQREQYSYQVTDTQVADGSDAVRIEETIKRETIIQDAVENTPATATEMLSVTSSGEDSATFSETKEPALRVINPARPMDAYTSQAEQAELVATESVTVTTDQPEAVTTVVGNPFGNPFAPVEAETGEPLSAAPDTAWAGETLEPAVVATSTLAASTYSFSGTPAAQFAYDHPQAQVQDQANWEESLEKTRQEFNERIDKMESQFMERLERVEKLLASQFVRAHQEQGG